MIRQLGRRTALVDAMLEQSHTKRSEGSVRSRLMRLFTYKNDAIKLTYDYPFCLENNNYM